VDERHQIGGSDFIWDIAKAKSNLRNHGVRFEEAATVFLDPLLVIRTRRATMKRDLQ
jgi:uncharacterized protein